MTRNARRRYKKDEASTTSTDDSSTFSHFSPNPKKAQRFRPLAGITLLTMVFEKIKSFFSKRRNGSATATNHEGLGSGSSSSSEKLPSKHPVAVRSSRGGLSTVSKLVAITYLLY